MTTAQRMTFEDLMAQPAEDLSYVFGYESVYHGQ